MPSLFDTLSPEDKPAVPLDNNEETDWAGLSGKAFSRAVLDSREFKRYIVDGLLTRELPAAVITRIMDHAWGKPVERVELRQPNEFDDVSVEDVEKRISYLAGIVQDMRRNQQQQTFQIEENSIITKH